MATLNDVDNGIRRVVDYGYDEAVEKVTEALKTEGFGVLTKINVKETMEKKGQPWEEREKGRKYIILGACNPPFAFKALGMSLDIGLMLPCNIVVFERDDGKTQVLAIDPLVSFSRMRGLTDDAAAMAVEVQAKLVAALNKL